MPILNGFPLGIAWRFLQQSQTATSFPLCRSPFKLLTRERGGGIVRDWWFLYSSEPFSLLIYYCTFYHLFFALFYAFTCFLSLISGMFYYAQLALVTYLFHSLTPVNSACCHVVVFYLFLCCLLFVVYVTLLHLLPRIAP